MLVVCHKRFVYVTEYLAFARFARLIHCQIVRTENHILRRNSYRLTVGWLKQIVCGKHKETCFCLSFCRKGKMYSHLVAVEVGIESRTYKRMKLDCTSLDKNWFKCLNTKTVKRGGTVQHYRVILDNVLKSVPHLIVGTVNKLSC